MLVTSPSSEAPDRSFEPFTPTSRRRRLIMAGLALATTLGIGGAMLTPHAASVRAALALKFAEPQPCAPGQLRGCVGGAMDIFVLPAPAAASAASAAAASAPTPAASGTR